MASAYLARQIVESLESLGIPGDHISIVVRDIALANWGIRGGAADSATTTVIAHGRLVDPASLALVPGHLYWLEDGVPHTVAVP